MINLFLLLVINSLICVGLYKAMQFEFSEQYDIDKNGERIYLIDNNTKGILWWYKCYFLDEIPYRISKPFGNCLTCMASVFSFVPYWFWYCEFNFLSPFNWVFYPFYIFALAGLNTIADKFVNE